MSNHLPPSSHEWQICQSNSSGLRRLNRGSCCTPKFALSFLKAFLTRILKNSSLHKYNWISQHQVKEETVKKGKAGKMIFWRRSSLLRFTRLRLDFGLLQAFFDFPWFVWTLVSFKTASVGLSFMPPSIHTAGNTYLQLASTGHLKQPPSIQKGKVLLLVSFDS